MGENEQAGESGLTEHAGVHGQALQARVMG